MNEISEIELVQELRQVPDEFDEKYDYFPIVKKILMFQLRGGYGENIE